MYNTLITIAILSSAFGVIFGIIAMNNVLEEKGLKVVTYIFSLAVVVFLESSASLITHTLMLDSKWTKETAGLTKIEAYYEYTGDNDYKLITKADTDKTRTEIFDEALYADDFGRVFVVADESEKLFKPVVTKTEVKSSDTNKKILPKYPEDTKRFFNVNAVKKSVYANSKLKKVIK